MKRTIVLALILKVGLLGIAVEQLAAQGKGDEPAVMRNGDINGDGGRNITDALQLLGWLFGDAPSPVEFKVDGDQAARISELERQLAEAKEAIATLEVELEDAPRGCNFPGAYFYYANLRELDFRDANLEGADLRGAYLDLADLRGANLQNANLGGAELNRADLRGANIEGADLRGALLDAGSLVVTVGTPAFMPEDMACDLVGPEWATSRHNGAVWRRMNFSECILEGEEFSFANLIEANLYNAKLSGAVFVESNLSWANLVGADLEGASMYEAELGFARFNGANLIGAELEGARMMGTRFQDADLRNVSFQRAYLRITNMEGADLRGANFTGAILEEVNFNGADLRGVIGLNLGSVNGVPAYMPGD